MPGLRFVWRHKVRSVAAAGLAAELVVDARPDQIDVLTDLYRSRQAGCGIEWSIDRRVAEHDAQILSLDGPVAAQRVFRSEAGRPAVSRFVDRKRVAQQSARRDRVVPIAHIDAGNRETTSDV